MTHKASQKFSIQVVRVTSYIVSFMDAPILLHKHTMHTNHDGFIQYFYNFTNMYRELVHCALCLLYKKISLISMCLWKCSTCFFKYSKKGAFRDCKKKEDFFVLFRFENNFHVSFIIFFLHNLKQIRTLGEICLLCALNVISIENFLSLCIIKRGCRKKINCIMLWGWEFGLRWFWCWWLRLCIMHNISQISDFLSRRWLVQTEFKRLENLIRYFSSSSSCIIFY